MNGYNFTERVRQVLAMAREEALQRNHQYVGTEHILLGIIAEGEGIAVKVLQNLKTDLAAIRQSIDEVVQTGNALARTTPELPYTSRAKRVLELAMCEARDFGHGYVGTEHLLLGLIGEETGIAAQVLARAGVSLGAAEAETLRLLGSPMRGRSRMSIFLPAPSVWTNRMLAVVRIVTGLVFISYGTMKLFNFPPLPAGMPPIPLMSEAGIAGILETFGGILIVLGLLTRPVAFILAGEMAVAYFQFAYPVSFWPSSNNGSPAVLYCFLFLYFVFAGPGDWSVDAIIARRRAAESAKQVVP
jgi:uncharacterized membrane protein YphA (DoxX/SURF4 family)